MNEKESLLKEIKSLDINGWCMLTDGSLESEYETEDEQIEQLRETLNFIKEIA